MDAVAPQSTPEICTYRDVQFHWLSSEEEAEVRGTVQVRPGEMVIEITDRTRVDGPYTLVGRRRGGAYVASSNIAQHPASPVAAKWAEVDGDYVGLWVEDGTDYMFRFRLPAGVASSLG